LSNDRFKDEAMESTLSIDCFKKMSANRHCQFVESYDENRRLALETSGDSNDEDDNDNNK
jgi:hypothetical protein